MTIIQEQAIQQFPGEKAKAFKRLESLSINIPENFDADEELRLALEEKYEQNSD